MRHCWGQGGWTLKTAETFERTETCRTSDSIWKGWGLGLEVYYPAKSESVWNPGAFVQKPQRKCKHIPAPSGRQQLQQPQVACVCHRMEAALLGLFHPRETQLRHRIHAASVCCSAWPHHHGALLSVSALGPSLRGSDFTCLCSALTLILLHFPS